MKIRKVRIFLGLLFSKYTNATVTTNTEGRILRLIRTDKEKSRPDIERKAIDFLFR